MYKSILITGISGTGKTTVSLFLHQEGYKSFSIEDITGVCKMINRETGVETTHDIGSDLETIKKHDWICDKRKVGALLQKNKDELIFYTGVCTNLDDLLPFFDKIFLLQVNQKELTRRLNERTNNRFGKSNKVQQWIFDHQIEFEKKLLAKGAVPIDATKSIKDVAITIIEESESS